MQLFLIPAQFDLIIVIAWVGCGIGNRNRNVLTKRIGSSSIQTRQRIDKFSNAAGKAGSVQIGSCPRVNTGGVFNHDNWCRIVCAWRCHVNLRDSSV